MTVSGLLNALSAVSPDTAETLITTAATLAGIVCLGGLLRWLVGP
jgi:hypothetical protein